MFGLSESDKWRRLAKFQSNRAHAQSQALASGRGWDNKNDALFHMRHHPIGTALPRALRNRPPRRRRLFGLF